MFFLGVAFPHSLTGQPLFPSEDDHHGWGSIGWGTVLWLPGRFVVLRRCWVGACRNQVGVSAEVQVSANIARPNLPFVNFWDSLRLPLSHSQTVVTFLGAGAVRPNTSHHLPPPPTTSPNLPQLPPTSTPAKNEESQQLPTSRHPTSTLLGRRRSPGSTGRGRGWGGVGWGVGVAFLSCFFRWGGGTCFFCLGGGRRFFFLLGGGGDVSFFWGLPLHFPFLDLKKGVDIFWGGRGREEGSGFSFHVPKSGPKCYGVYLCHSPTFEYLDRRTFLPSILCKTHHRESFGCGSKLTS